MSDNDLIRRGDVLAMAEMYIGGDGDEWEAVDVDDIADIPAVEPPMSAREFVTTISDMCINQFPAGCTPCPLWVTGQGCGEKILPPEQAVAIVQKWAREHLERRKK